MNGIDRTYSHTQWLNQVKSVAEANGWLIQEEPFELDPELRCIFPQQLKIKREREAAERRRVQQEEKERKLEAEQKKKRDYVEPSGFVGKDKPKLEKVLGKHMSHKKFEEYVHAEIARINEEKWVSKRS